MIVVWSCQCAVRFQYEGNCIISSLPAAKKSCVRISTYDGENNCDASCIVLVTVNFQRDIFLSVRVRFKIFWDREIKSSWKDRERHFREPEGGTQVFLERCRVDPIARARGSDMHRRRQRPVRWKPAWPNHGERPPGRRSCGRWLERRPSGDASVTRPVLCDRFDATGVICPFVNSSDFRQFREISANFS